MKTHALENSLPSQDHAANLLAARAPRSNNRAPTYTLETGQQHTQQRTPVEQHKSDEQLLSRPWLDPPGRTYRRRRLRLQKARRPQGSSSDLGGPQQCRSLAHSHARLDLLDCRRNRQPLL